MYHHKMHVFCLHGEILQHFIFILWSNLKRSLKYHCWISYLKSHEHCIMNRGRCFTPLRPRGINQFCVFPWLWILLIQLGEAFFGLWNYEVVECFFLSQIPGSEPDYLELEFGPHGQHLGLLLHGVRKAIKHTFPIRYQSEISSDKKTWTGKAVIPKHYFPPNVNR